MNKKTRNIVIIAVVLVAVILLAWYIIYNNRKLGVTEYTITSENLPSEFDGLCIVQISDLHNEEFGEDNEKVISLVLEQHPDMIVITGDIVDMSRTDISVAVRLCERLVGIAPVYYVNGNHENSVKDIKSLYDGMEKCGVNILLNEAVELKRGDDSITLIGVSDPSENKDYLLRDYDVAKSHIDKLNTDGFTILLSHRPELFDLYVSEKMDLVFTGHAHGGQFRLPLVGGVIAPNQGLFPKYDSGVYEKDGTSMVVSRGLGNSVIPFRVNNNPEIVVVRVKTTIGN